MKTIKMNSILILFLIIGNCAFAQDFSRNLPPFTKIIVGNRINVVILNGNNHSICGTVKNVSLNNLNIRVRNGRLLVYLDKAKLSEKHKTDWSEGYKRRIPYYGDSVKVNVFITCETLEKLEIRGEQDAICEKPLNVEEFKLVVYGEPIIRFNQLNVGVFKAYINGECDLNIMSGNIQFQRLYVLGENNINIRQIKNEYIRITSLGENKFYLPKNSTVKITSLGESEFYSSANTFIKKRLVIGNNTFDNVGAFSYNLNN